MCSSAISTTAAVLQRLANNLAALRPLIVNSAFDVSETMSAIRASASTTSLESMAVGPTECDAGGSWDSAISEFQSALKRVLDPALSTSVSDPSAVRARAVKVWQTLPLLQSLSAKLIDRAETLGLSVAALELPSNATKALGTLPALTAAVAVSTPRPTAKGTTPGKPGTATAPPGGSRGTVNTAALKTLSAYSADWTKAYSGMAFSPIYIDFYVCSDSDYGPEGRAACFSALEARAKTFTRFDAHRKWMSSHPLKCLKAAYAKDRSLMNYLERVLNLGWLAVGTNPSGIESRIKAFSNQFPSYAKGCA